jgi:hypothetical protein
MTLVAVRDKEEIVRGPEMWEGLRAIETTKGD